MDCTSPPTIPCMLTIRGESLALKNKKIDGSQQIFHSSLFTLNFFSYLCTRFIKGCSQLWAEMIPSEPDTDNADAGMMSKHDPLIFSINNKVKEHDKVFHDDSTVGSHDNAGCRH